MRLKEDKRSLLPTPVQVNAPIPHDDTTASGGRWADLALSPLGQTGSRDIAPGVVHYRDVHCTYGVLPGETKIEVSERWTGSGTTQDSISWVYLETTTGPGVLCLQRSEI